MKNIYKIYTEIQNNNITIIIKCVNVCVIVYGPSVCGRSRHSLYAENPQDCDGKTASESTTRLRLFSTVSKRGTHLAENFFT